MTAPTAPPTSSPENPMPDLYARRLSDRLQYQSRQIQTLNRAARVAQLPNSSLEDDWINMYDASAQLAMRLGKQEDGLFTLKYMDGTPPPVPAAPLVQPGEGSIRVGVDATWAVPGTKPPSNLSRFDIHASMAQGFTVGPNTAYSSVPRDGGVESFPASNTDWYVKIVAVTDAGVKSGASEEIHVVPYPFTTLAAYSVGAQQLQSKIILASRLIIGDPTSTRIEMEPNVGLTTYNSSNVRTFWQDPSTGNVTLYGRIMGDPAGSDSNIVMGERIEGLSAVKFAYGTPVDDQYNMYVSQIARSAPYGASAASGANAPIAAEMRFLGPDFLNRRQGPNLNITDPYFHRAYFAMGPSVTLGVLRNSSKFVNAYSGDGTAGSYDMITAQINQAGFTYRGSWRNFNDNWQPVISAVVGENAWTGDVGFFGMQTAGSGYNWKAGVRVNFPNDSINANGKGMGPNLQVLIQSQPAVWVQDHRAINLVPLYCSSAGPSSSALIKNSIERAPVSDEKMLDGLRKIVPAHFFYDQEQEHIKELRGKNYGFLIEDFDDAGLGWLAPFTGSSVKPDERFLDYFGLVAWLAACVRTLDEELDVLRKANKVESPRRVKQVRSRRVK